MQERAIAEGQRLAAQGGFDLNVDAYSLAQPLGFYKMYRTGVTATQPLWRGGYVYGGYRIGDGNFPTWYGERETNEGGEFKLGATLPLWRDRPIDKRRGAVAQANLARAAADPSIQTQLLDIDRAAAMAYWSWVAAGASLRVERNLLGVAEVRNAAIKRRVELGDLPGSEAVDNDRVVAARRLKVVAAERKLQESAIKLSLYLRSSDGQPLVPTPDVLPADFPKPLPPRTDNLPTAIERAWSARPEIRELSLLRQSLAVDLRLAENLTRPALDATVWGSKDVGAAASEKRDKTPYEMEGGLLAEVPLQRREARGKIRAVQAKIAQVTAKQRFTNDKIAAEVRDAHSAIVLAYARVLDASSNVALARQMESFERRRFELGDSNIFMVNQRETAAVEARLAEIEALADYHRALANFRTSLADRAAELALN
jgi:outer membrane protein TolC